MCRDHAAHPGGVEAGHPWRQEPDSREAVGCVGLVTPRRFLGDDLPHGERRPGSRKLLGVLSDVVTADQDHGRTVAQVPALGTRFPFREAYRSTGSAPQPAGDGLNVHQHDVAAFLFSDS